MADLRAQKVSSLVPEGPGAMDLLFAHLNLRFNPFGELAARERGRLAVVEIPEIVPGHVVQYIGRAGRGKSTHLRGLEAALAEARYEYLPKGQHRFLTSPESCDFLLLDEAQRLYPTELRRLFASFERLVLGTHWSLSMFSRRPFLTIKIRGLSQKKLRLVVDKRIEWARRAPGPVPFLTDADLDALIARFGDDLRSIERLLYDSFQQLEAPLRVRI